MTDTTLDPVLAHLARLSALNLRDYRRETLERRVVTRMNAVGATSASRYSRLTPRRTHRLA